jgi:sugar lactone lactonase YvrE
MLRTIPRLKKTGFLFTLLMLGLPLVAQAIAPTFLPSFPMRAGAVAILMWAPVPGATEYKVLKKVDAGAYAEVYKGPVNNYSDPSAPADKTLTYKVIPIIGGKEGDPSPEAVLVGIKPLDAPTITGVLADPGGLRVRWTVVNGAAFYNLYRAEAAEGPFTLVTSIQEPQYFDRAPKAGKPFYYQVSAVDKMSTESGKSPVGSGKVEEVVKADTFTPIYKEYKQIAEYLGQENNEFKNPVFFFETKKGEWCVVDKSGLVFLDKTGKYVHRSYLETEWGFPHAGVVDPKENLLLTFNSEKIYRLDLEGTLLSTFTVKAPVEKPDSEVKLGSIALDGKGNIWVSDYNSGQVVILEPAEGKEIGRVGYVMNMPVEKQHLKDSVIIAVPGRIAYKAKGNQMWVIDGMNAVIDIFDADKHSFIKTIGGRKAKGGLDFEGISGFVLRPNGNALVADSMAGIVKEFDPDLKYLATYLDPNAKPKKKLMVEFPSNIYLDSKGELFVLSNLIGKLHRYPVVQP